MLIVQAHWSIPTHMTICNQAYLLTKTILTRHYYSILYYCDVIFYYSLKVMPLRHYYDI